MGQTVDRYWNLAGKIIVRQIETISQKRVGIDSENSSEKSLWERKRSLRAVWLERSGMGPKRWFCLRLRTRSWVRAVSDSNEPWRSRSSRTSHETWSWLNIAKSGVYLRYRHCSKLFRELRKEIEFRQRYCWKSTKVWERKRKSGREKILNFGNHITEKLAAQTCWLKTNCGNAIAEMGKKNWWQLWQCHCRK